MTGRDRILIEQLSELLHIFHPRRSGLSPFVIADPDPQSQNPESSLSALEDSG